MNVRGILESLYYIAETAATFPSSYHGQDYQQLAIAVRELLDKAPDEHALKTDLRRMWLVTSGYAPRTLNEFGTRILELLEKGGYRPDHSEAVLKGVLETYNCPVARRSVGLLSSEL